MNTKRSLGLFAATAFLIACGALVSRADTHYVSAAGDNVAPYTNGWANAAWQIQLAVDQAGANDTVLVTNGTYDTGGITNWPAGTLLTNRVAITNAITVRSANNDPTNTIIMGAWDPATNGPAAVRCVYMAANSKLIGFTLTNGATLMTGTEDKNGGGVYCPSITTPIISNCVIVGNSAAAYGGGAYFGSLFKCAIVDNKAATGGGAAGLGTYVYMTNCTIARNRTTGSGGGVNQANLYNCVVASNSAANGGGAYLANMYDCLVISNSARGSGYGGGSMEAGTLSRCTIIGNSASVGGGVASVTALYNCLIVSNSASNTGAGSYDSALYNCTIAGNSATGECGGTLANTRKLLYNCIVYFNTGSSPVYANWKNGDFTNCCTTPLPSGNGNITYDPQFVNTNTGDYHLSANSPCVNTGVNGSWTTTYPLDFDGRQRIRYRTVDMGAYETIYKGTVFTVF